MVGWIRCRFRSSSGGVGSIPADTTDSLCSYCNCTVTLGKDRGCGREDFVPITF